MALSRHTSEGVFGASGFVRKQTPVESACRRRARSELRGFAAGATSRSRKPSPGAGLPVPKSGGSLELLYLPPEGFGPPLKQVRAPRLPGPGPREGRQPPVDDPRGPSGPSGRAAGTAPGGWTRTPRGSEPPVRRSGLTVRMSWRDAGSPREPAETAGAAVAPMPTDHPEGLHTDSRFASGTRWPPGSSRGARATGAPEHPSPGSNLERSRSEGEPEPGRAGRGEGARAPARSRQASLRRMSGRSRPDPEPGREPPPNQALAPGAGRFARNRPPRGLRPTR